EVRATLDARTCEGVRDLQAPGPAADHHDVVVAGRERALGAYSGQTFAAPSRRASICSIRYMTLGCLSMNVFSSLFGIVRQRSIVVATTSAVGNASVRIEISPKKSPRVRRARSFPSITTLASPSRIT